MEVYTRLASLDNLLNQAQVAVCDTETSGLDPHRDVLVGVGFFFPEIGEAGTAAYINLAHFIRDNDFPRATEQEFVATVRPFFANPSKRVVGHSLSFDLRFLFSIGITDVRCRTSDSLIAQHRADENLREKGVDCTTHPTGDVGFGLKKVMRLFWNEQPPTILQATGGLNTLAAPPSSVGRYCVRDCTNSWRVYQRSFGLLDQQGKWLSEHIDDPNTLVIAKMMWQGLGLDMNEASQQVEQYEQAIELCREEIWTTLGDPHRPLFTKPKALKHLLSDLLGIRVYSTTGETLRYLVKDVATTERQRKIIALLIVWKSMRQRLSSFLRPLPEKVIDGRIHPTQFSSTLVTTRFSSKPNLQNLPKRADKVSEEDDWLNLVPENCKPALKTRNIIAAKAGCVLVEIDYSAAEPRYLASVFQRAITEKDSWYKNERAVLRGVREAMYGQLIQRMRETRIDKVYVPNNIVWPTYQEDPLWRVFKFGIPVSDPYDALLMTICNDEYLAKQAEGSEALEQWFADERKRGKRAWLALAYGSKAASLAPQLKWTVERTQEAIDALENTYEMLLPLRELTLRSVLHLGKVKTLWGRMRRLNGFYQLAGVEPVKIRFHYAGEKNKWTGKSSFRRYEAEIIPLGSWRRGVQAFIQDCWLLNKDGTPDVSVLRGTEDGLIEFIDESDYFVCRPHYNVPPFRNVPFSAIEWVQEANGLTRYLGRQEHAERQAFNFLAQGCGADHLRTTMNAIDAEICTFEEFRDCRLVLTIHDSLCYEVPQEKASAFIAAITPVARRRPDWCDFDIEISVEVGRRMGELKPP